MTEITGKDNNPLLSEFPVPDLAAWRTEVERLLKGTPFTRAMFTKTLAGIVQGPMPTAADTDALPWLQTLPGQAPFVRGAHASGYHQSTWSVDQELPLSDPAEFNKGLLHDLEQGQTAVRLLLDTSGRPGTSIHTLEDFRIALSGVDLAKQPLSIEAGYAALPVAAMLAVLLDEAQVDPRQISGRLGCDPLEGLARHGTLPCAAGQLYDQLAVLTQWAVRAPRLRTLPVSEITWHEGGADHALSLGLTLAGALHVLREMQQRGFALQEIVGRIHFQLAVDTDFFSSLAKLRALRLLWSQIQVKAGLVPVPASIHARTSRRMMAALEPYPNLLRTTTAAMAAVLGGVDSLHTGCFDEIINPPSEFSRRVARNVQLILSHEVHLDQVGDPAGGAWYPEKLTADLATAAWSHVQKIEGQGGIIEALTRRVVQEQVAAVATERSQRLSVGKDIMVGVNRFVDADWREIKRPLVSPAGKILTAQGKASPLPSAQVTDFASVMASVRNGASLEDFLAQDSEAQTVEPIPLRRDAAPFEAIRYQILAQAESPATGVACLCLGDPARYMPRLDFVRGFFQAGGFKVMVNGFSETAASAVQSFSEAGAATVVLVGLDQTYTELAVETATLLAAVDPPPRVMLAGKPGPLEAELRQAGVDEFLHARSGILEVLGRLAATAKEVS